MSFRKYGGTQFARSHNIVKSSVNTSDSFYVTKNVGQPNTYINFESDISGNVNIYGVLDVSGNLIVSGDADINGKLYVQEDIDCSGNVNIDGNIDCIGDITANEFFITGPIDSAPNSVVPKSYVDSVAVGLTPLAPCVLCSNVGNIPLTGHGQTIDGFTISSVYDGSFVLINAQGGVGVAAVTNGVYVVSSGTWLRPTELENGDKATGTAMLIKQGVVNAGKTFVCTSGSDTIPAYIGTSPVLWHEFLSPYSLGQGLNKTVVNGNTVINVDSSLNFIQYLDNTAPGPNQNILNIGTNTPTVNIGKSSGSATCAMNAITTFNQIPSCAVHPTTQYNLCNKLYVDNSASKWTTEPNTNTNIYYNSGFVGIGTTTPQYTLDVSGNVNVTNGILKASGGITTNTVTGNTIGNSGFIYSENNRTGDIYFGNGTNRSCEIRIGSGSGSTGGVQILSNSASGAVLTLGNPSSSTSIFGFTAINTSTTNETRIGNIANFLTLYGSIMKINTYPGTQNETQIGNTFNPLTLNGNTMNVNTVSGTTNIGNTSGTTNFNGNVGIGTTPSSTLDVSGNARIRGRTYFGIDNPGGGADDTAYMEYVVISGENTCLKIVAENDSSPGQADNIALMPSANVGIGTTTPQYLLDVSGNGNFIGIKSYGNSSTAANNPPDFNATTTNNHNLVLVSTKTGSTPYSMALGVDYTDGFGYINVAGDGNYKYLCLQTRGGNVGIGTTEPIYSLDVSGNGNIRVTSGTSNTNPSVIIIKDPGNFADFVLDWQHQAQLQVQNSNAGSMVLGMSTDGVGIIQGTTTNVGYNDICLNPHLGNVGIGTFTPGSKLDVNGNIRASNTLLLTNGSNQSSIFQLGSAFNIQNGNPDGYIYINAVGKEGLIVYPNSVGINGAPLNTLYALDVSGGGNFTGYVNIGNGLGVTGGLTSNNATVCTGILTANGGITATAGIGTTTLTASGLITALSPGSGDNSSNVPTTSWVNTAISGSSSASKWTTQSGTNNIYYNNSGGFVGIGTTTPGYPLDVSGNTRIRGKTYFGIDDPGGGVGDTAYIEYVVILGEQTTLRINVQNDTNDNINLNPTGNVGINTDTPAYKLDVNGNVGATSYNTTSDYRIKKDVVTLDETFTVDKLRPVTYNNTKLDKQDIGLIAHELEEIYPFLVNGEKDGENFQTVNYTGLIGILIKEIQELKERVKKLEEK